MPYDYQPFPYVPPPGLQGPEPRHPVVIVGAGPIGLAAALDLAGHGIASVVLDDNNVVSVGSRAICWSKRSLEILDRLGVGARIAAKGVTWKIGRTFHGEEEIFNFDLLPEDGHKMPAFVNLQQYYVEQFLVEECRANDLVDLRFKNTVTGLGQTEDGVQVEIDTPDGSYALVADYLLACDGAKSPIRGMMGLDFEGELFEERFLIADIEMTADFPSERWFWFEPPFHAGQSALLHKQPDNIYRIDLQLGWDADPEAERQPEVVIPRIERVVGHADFRLDWVSVYTFQCRRLARFVHDRVIFVGDSAHVVSPFGARGGNGGLQDVDALGWRLAAVLKGDSPAELLEGYDRERTFGADENIRNSARTTRFMTPRAGAERLFRDQVLALAGKVAFARPLVNSGRLSRPCIYPMPDAPDAPTLPVGACPGSVAPDAPMGNGWLMDRLGGKVTLLLINTDIADLDGIDSLHLPGTPEVRARYLGDAESAVYLIRPDQIVAARWTAADANAIRAEVSKLLGTRA
ncbi:2-polyprenyl-6-methoxyphenol hydroxylase [Roseibacterium elongatum DSM 19469]|uniref:2-polyprenyl-6-methoxyphenol hydroxylase n=1 Tax=Roseicyclus elongatus DSM 19469 TaxID=1294273 RepID=W8RPV3_9RHOB|nr:FAD-dependent oxidoreductase [Roseibacterium elongatum]AHM03209.1 2-polyprenyl-6-methoxyphenol hydroxylase [Roseibacterium elongatum DSM 19469]